MRSLLALLTCSFLLLGCGGTTDRLRDHAFEATETILIGACDPGEPVELTGYDRVGRRLYVEVQHGGGCERHAYIACMHDPHPDVPQRYRLTIRRDGHGDLCRGEVTQILQIDLDRDLRIVGHDRSSITLVP